MVCMFSRPLSNAEGVSRAIALAPEPEVGSIIEGGSLEEILHETRKRAGEPSGSDSAGLCRNLTRMQRTGDQTH